MVKSKLSGAENRKRALEQTKTIEKVIKQTKRIDSFFIHPTSASISSSSIIEKCDSLNIDSSSPSKNFNEEVTSSSKNEITSNINDNSILQADNLLPSNDPAEWKSNDWYQESIARLGFLQFSDADFNISKREYPDKNRYCTKTLFYKKLPNGENILRKWMVYSLSKGSLFCAICKLFGADNQFGYEGFNDWKNGNNRIICRENSFEHKKNIVSFVSRQRDSGRINSELASQITNEIKYWSAVLNRVIEIIKYLTSRGLSLRGSDEHIGSLHNGNFLGAIELLAKFDPFMSNHVAQYGNAGKGVPSYLSKTIYEELIILMHKKITSEILNQIKIAKYYSIIVDSTPDIAHIDQLCFVIRYVLDEGSPVERFLIFFENSGHKSKELAETVLEV
ncbi:hypothetical protein AGLY_018242 [Aphis glycines]|uniref:DUF4371 domain-containing protein n=1 Tax=Aphis glycines TaxID=307491 RepID=A0A6G0SSX2_APHGL|nr:hypothetical protein AGLY_018242 [Aphis glycines]